MEAIARFILGDRDSQEIIHCRRPAEGRQSFHLLPSCNSISTGTVYDEWQAEPQKERDLCLPLVVNVTDNPEYN
jgi:hypothetical protein